LIEFRGRLQSFAGLKAPVQQVCKQVGKSTGVENSKQSSILRQADQCCKGVFYHLGAQCCGEAFFDHLEFRVDHCLDRMGTQNFSAQAVNGADAGGIHL
jgi:hypothetical protein